MWEHRTVSNKEYQTTGRINPNETYVRLMDEVEESVKKAQVEEFAYEAFMDYIPREDHGKNCRNRHVSFKSSKICWSSKSKILNTNLFLG